MFGTSCSLARFQKACFWHIDDPEWTTLFQEASKMAEKGVKEDPKLRIERWPVENAPDLTLEAKDIVTKMMRLDPAQRVSIDTVLAHPWWYACGMESKYHSPTCSWILSSSKKLGPR